MKSPLIWYGGKGRLVRHIVPLAPKQYSTFAELYAGGASVFFGKDPSEKEILNDIDPEVTNFYRVLQGAATFLRFQAMAAFTPYARALHAECKQEWASEKDPIMRAWRWWILVRQTFAGKFASSWAYKVSTNQNAAKTFALASTRFAAVHTRLQATTIMNTSALTLIKDARPGWWLYLDPPYLADTRVSPDEYTHEVSDTHHRLLVDLLLRTDAMVLISGYIHPIYRPLEDAGWRRVDIPIACYSAGTTAYDKRTGERKSTAHRSMRVESLWLNYDPATSKLIVK